MNVEDKRNLEYEVPSRLEAIPKATQKMFDFLKHIELNDSDRFDLRLCFEEILINAIKHGNKLKKDVSARVIINIDGDRIQVIVTDQGPGFDYKELRDPTTEDNIRAYSGRGVYLVKHLMDELKYNEKGNRVEIVKCIHKIGGK